MAELGHSRRFGFVRFRRHCRPEFLRQGRDGPSADLAPQSQLSGALRQDAAAAPRTVGRLCTLRPRRNRLKIPHARDRRGLLMRASMSGTESDRISARNAPGHSAFAISIAFICTYAIFALAVIPFAGNPGPKAPSISLLFAATVFATEL